MVVNRKDNLLEL